jgi:hypothetical protein
MLKQVFVRNLEQTESIAELTFICQIKRSPQVREIPRFNRE